VSVGQQRAAEEVEDVFQALLAHPFAERIFVE